MKEHTNSNSKMEMAWNEPGNNGDDPWGGGKKRRPGSGSQGPDIDEMINKIREKFSGGGAGSGWIGIVLLATIVGLWSYNSIYMVRPAELGVEFRFGKYLTTTRPGPHFLFFPIESVEIVNVKNLRKEEIGHRKKTGRERRAGNVKSEALMLTKDENIVSIKFTVQYILNDPKQYLINLKNPDTTLFEVAQSAIREVVGKSKMDFIFSEGKSEVISKTKEMIQETLDSYKSGITVNSVNIEDVQPPDQVRAAFADVVKAREDRERYVNKAESYRNSILPVARGKASRIISEANGYREQVVAKAQGETARFNQILNQYRKAPEITRKRMYLETMQEILGKSPKVIMDADNNSMLMLPLDKLSSVSSSEAAAAAAQKAADIISAKEGKIKTLPRRTRNRIIREGR